MGFLSDLGGVLNDQFGIGENTTHSLDSEYAQYGNLGDFADRIDKTAERSYIEDGFIRNLRPRSRSVLFQQPDIYVVVKKRMFSTLDDNVRLDILEEKERILVAASKRLFQNKCRVIQAYERLTKMERLSFDSERFNTFLGPSFLNLLDSGSIFGLFDLGGSTKSAIDTLRRVVSYAEPGELTNWTNNDFDAVFADTLGEGPGTFELTSVASVNTTVSTDWGGGEARLTIEDPYNLMTITERDIDQAISDIANPTRTGDFFKFTMNELGNLISELKSELAVVRGSRGASQISFRLSPGTLLSKRVRAILDGEGAEIKFEYSTGVQGALEGSESVTNFGDVASSVDSAFSTGSVEVDPRFIRGNDPIDIDENNQLSSSELSIFTQIIANTFNLLAQRQTSQREQKTLNAELNYTRNRMRLFFNGKYIIQPLDQISIFMTSRTNEDGQQPGGFQKQQNQAGVQVGQAFDTLLTNINGAIQDLSSSFSVGDDGGINGNLSFDDIERLNIVGPHMPKWLWRQFKPDITNQPTGPCIFSGIVGKQNQGVTGSWENGKWTVSLSCEDNSGYFNKGQVNFKPAADVFNSSIYDPLTPFDVSFDASTGAPITNLNAGDFPPLLPENQKLLQSGIATFRSGPNRGGVANETNYKNRTDEFSFEDFRRVLHNPEGMVYRWKQGIQTLTFTSRPQPQTSIDQERAVLLTEQPFAGQDVMNVISLLITGQPYDYGNFLKAAIENGNSQGVKKDDVTNISATATFIQGLISDLEKQNAIWGNFIPYKKLTMNPAIDKFIAETSIASVTLNQKIRQKISERAKAEDELMLLNLGGNVSRSDFRHDEQGRLIPNNETLDTNGLGAPIQTRVNALSQEIANLQKEFDETINNSLANNPDVGITLIGNEVDRDPSLTSLNDTKDNVAQRQRNELELRKRLFRNTARRYWQVRANEDKNLFIVDDQYDRNFDIQAFSRALAAANSIETFNSQYSTVGEKIENVAKILGLEVFANTQGHIEVRPPGYNRIPSSVFYQMFKDKAERGVKVYPDFLENLYFNQIRGLFNQIEIIEDEIRIRAIALGANSDKEVVELIATGNANSGLNFDATLFLLTSETGDGRIGIEPIKNLLTETDPDGRESRQSQALETLTDFGERISDILKVRNLFTTSVQTQALDSFNPNITPDTQASKMKDIRDRLRRKTGREPKDIDDLFGNDRFRTATDQQTASRTDRVNIIRQIAGFVAERQRAMRSALNAIRNMQESVVVNGSTPDNTNPDIFSGGLQNLFSPSNNNNAAKTLSTPFLNRDTEIPQVFEHMIEYENDHDIGYQSGRRFIVTGDRIARLTISENPPPFTMVAVKGLFGEGLPADPAGFKTSDDGNGITTAYAVDYDMWYQYGFRSPKTIEAPFFSDPDSQCSPYAVATLLTARENILQGSVDIVGYNEYHQPGEVVYIEDRNLLFYVKSVQHSFSYGKLTTTLQLTYGHSPGEYIPTMLDVAGKVLYGSRGFTGQFNNEKQERNGQARSIGALIIDDVVGTSGFGDPDPMEKLLKGRYGERNKSIMSNMLFSLSGSLNKVTFRRQKARVKLVVYKTSDSNINEIGAVVDAVSDWLINPESESPESLGGEGEIGSLQPIRMAEGTQHRKNFGLNKDDIIVEIVDIETDTMQTRERIRPEAERTDPLPNDQGPSNAAWAGLRALVPSEQLEASRIKLYMANAVIDVFVDYEKVEKTTSQSSGNSEQQQEDNADIQTARTAQGQRSQRSIEEDPDFVDPFGEQNL